MQPFNLDRLVPEYVRNFETYIPSRPDRELMRMFGVDHLHRLNNNENHLGPPTKACRIIEQFPAEQAAVYPQGDCYYLRCGLAEKFNKDPEQFLVGNGSTEVIASVIKAFCGPGDNIITADKTFSVYEWVAEFSGFEARLIPLKDYGFDPEAMLAAIDDRTRVIFICNPNNPTGSWWNRDTLVDFLQQVAGQSSVGIDEAYVEYVEQEDFPDCMALMEEFPNLVVFRTFSKMYGLAALRVGYLCGPLAVLDIIRRTHVVYSVNTLAQEAALAAITDDQTHIAQSRAMVRAGKQILTAVCADLGLDLLCGEGSYLMIRVPLSDTLLYRKLLKQGMMIRTMTGFRFPGWIRVSMAEEEVMREFADTLVQTLQT
jgi:histidinol-phosphate aminotransferase